MKVAYYAGGNMMVDVNFRFVGAPTIESERGIISFCGYHTQNSSETKASFELTFEEALALIERLKKAVASMPCPTCHRKSK